MTENLKKAYEIHEDGKSIFRHYHPPTKYIFNKESYLFGIKSEASKEVSSSDETESYASSKGTYLTSMQKSTHFKLEEVKETFKSQIEKTEDEMDEEIDVFQKADIKRMGTIRLKSNQIEMLLKPDERPGEGGIEDTTRKVDILKKIELTEKPSVEIWEMFNDEELDKIRTMETTMEKKKFIQKYLTNCHGIPKYLLSTFVHSILKFSYKNNFSNHKTKVLITIFLRTHQYLLYNNWTTPDEIYNLFTHYLHFHSIEFRPNSIKTFTIYDCGKISKYFCRIYLRYMPLIQYLMLPNFGMTLYYTDRFKDDEPKKKKKKQKK